MNSFKIRAALSVLLLALAGLVIMNVMAVAAPRANDVAWSVRCTSPKDKKTPKACEAFQQLSIQQKGQKTFTRLAEMGVGYPAEKKGKPRGVLILPLGVLLEGPMTLKIGDQGAAKFRIRYCEKAGCYAYLDFEQAQIDAMKKADKMTVSITAVTGKTIAIVMSLKGFGDALEKAKG